MNFICSTCGIQYGDSGLPPSVCKICSDPRQYIGWQGQEWTTMDDLKKEGYRCHFEEEEPGLIGIGIEPSFGIGQRALLILSSEGNVLWDCISLLDDEVYSKVDSLGGIGAMAFSHPHFYGAMVEWSDAFGGVPMYVPHADKDWVARSNPNILYWEESVRLSDDITVYQCGGHFDGSAVLHWSGGANGHGALLVGDTIYVVKDRRYVSFMRSIPNMIPLSEPEVLQIVDVTKGLKFDRIYSGWWERISKGGAYSVRTSAERYISAIHGRWDSVD